MKIFLISNMYPSKEDPVYGVFVKNIMEALKSSGALVTTQALIQGRPQGKLRSIMAYAHFFIQGVLGLFKNYDLIYCHYISHSAPVALLVKAFSSKPLVLNIHGSDLLAQTRSSNLLKPFRDRLLHKADLIIVPSHYFKKLTIKMTGLPEHLFFVSPSGGVAHVQDSIMPKSSSKFTLGYVGWLKKEKGIFLLLEIAQHLKDKASIDFEIIVAGDGIDKQQFLSEIDAQGLSNYIKCLGFFNQKKLDTVYNQMDILLFPTLLEESLGLVGLEAMSYGKPVIASKLGGISDYLNDGTNGYAVEANNPDAFCQAILKLYNNNQLIDTLGKNALLTAKDYHIQHINDNLYKQFIVLLNDESMRPLS